MVDKQIMRSLLRNPLAFLAVFTLIVVAAAPAHAQRKTKRDRKKTEQTTPQAIPTSLAVPIRPAGPVLSVESERHDFGRVEQGVLVKHTFTLHNDGSQDLVITDVKPSCGCTVPSWPREAIKPGEKADIQVTFNSAGKLGPQQKYIMVRTNMNDEVRNLYLVGEVVSPKIPLRADGTKN